jgi:Family of unknown function (DUF5947)
MSAGGMASALGALGQFAAKRRRAETCELCATELAEDHPHLVDPKARKLLCSCLACALLFGSQAGSKYKRVPRRIRFLAGFRLSDAEWAGLMIPINMAFFFKSSPEARVVAQYPSPAGATESQLPLDTWSDFAAANPALAEMESDVEALLVNRLGPTRGYSVPEYYLLPIDECYKLVWLIRSHWQGLSGGAEVWKELESFFADLKARSGASYA